MTRVALIHALAHSMAPINDEMARQWPNCERMNLLDDSLSADLARTPGGLDEAMTQRFVALADYAVARASCSPAPPSVRASTRWLASMSPVQPGAISTAGGAAHRAAGAEHADQRGAGLAVPAGRDSCGVVPQLNAALPGVHRL